MKTFAKCLFSGVVLALALALVFPVSGQCETRPEKRVVATIDQDGVQRVSILGGGYFYDPNYIVVKVNVPVEFSVTRESGMTPHDFVIEAPEAGIDIKIEMDTKPKLVSFTPTKPGKYEMVCTKKFLWINHRKKGMEGVLEVTE